jgi:hypothetical protein
MKAHISGIAYVNSNNLTVVINHCEDLGYSPLNNVEDLGTVQPDTVIHHPLKTVLTYYDVSGIGGLKTYRLTFPFGEQRTIAVFVPGAAHELPGTFTHNGYAADCSTGHDHLQELSDRSVQLFPVSKLYGAIPQLDPGDTLSFDTNNNGYHNLWEGSGMTNGVSFHGDTIEAIWNSQGYQGGKISDATPQTQFVQFVASIGNSLSNTAVDSSEELALQLILGNPEAPMVTGWVWGEGITECGPITKEGTFNVCKDIGSPSYFTVSNVDCDGNAVPSQYQNEELYGHFLDCGSCSTDCSGFSASLTYVSSDWGSPSGSFTISVTGGTANYTYLLIAPSGITYSGNPSPTATPNTSHTFTDVPATLQGQQWTIQVTDAAGCVRKFFMFMPGEGSLEGCTDSNAFNYEANATLEDGTCLKCHADGSLLLDGQSVTDGFVSDIGTQLVSPSTSATTDGSINFQGAAYSPLDPFLPDGTYTITLYTVSGSGAPLGASSASQSSLPYPSHTFTGLGEGWYAVRVTRTGSGVTCHSTFYYRLIPSRGTGPCVTTVSTAIDPCTGNLSVQVSSTTTPESVDVMLNGVVYPLSSVPPLQEGDDLTVIVGYPNGSGCDKYTENHTVTAADLNCEEGPAPEIHGCMDPQAANYDPIATVDTGNCLYDTFGCTDPAASNFDPTATIDNGTCEYHISGCTDPEATNFDPSATIDDGSCYNACSEPIIDTVVVADQIPTLSFINITTVYSVYWENLDTNVIVTTASSATGPSLIDGVYEVTVIDGNGCVDTKIFGVNTTVVYGCMDMQASNYNPAANAPFPQHPGHQCHYSLTPSPCIPRELPQIVQRLDECLSVLSDAFLLRLRGGRSTACKEKALKVLGLIRYLLSRPGTPCVFNCQDSLTPAYEETPQGTPCGTSWNEGGPSGAGLIWDASTPYVWGDVVKHPTSEEIYTMVSSYPYIPGTDPETIVGVGVWQFCLEPPVQTDSINRLDGMLTFIAEACKDCGLPGTPSIQMDALITDLPENMTIGNNPTTINGERIELKKK